MPCCLFLVAGEFVFNQCFDLRNAGGFLHIGLPDFVCTNLYRLLIRVMPILVRRRLAGMKDKRGQFCQSLRELLEDWSQAVGLA